MIISTPGFYPEVTPREYFNGFTPTRALTSTGIKRLLNTTPADYRYGETEDTYAKRMGDVVHQLALGKGRGYAVSDHPRWDRRIKDEKHRINGELPGEFLDRCEREGLTPIKRADFEAAEEMAVIVRERIYEAFDDMGYQTEVPFAWHEETPHGRVWCTGMLDVWSEARLTVIDPKITDRLHGAERQIVAMGWDIQNAWYRRGLTKIMPEAAGRIAFKNLLVSPQWPHTTRLGQITEGWRERAERDCERALHLFARCLHTNEWPGYPAEETWDEPSWSQNLRAQYEIEEEAAA